LGFLKQDYISRKALHRGVTHTAFDIAEIINKFDRKLFSHIIYPGHCLYHLLPPKPLYAAVIVLEKDNTPFSYPILKSCSLKTVSSTDAYLNLDDCILHYSPMCCLNFVHIVRIVRITLHFILCNRFYVLLLHSICNSMHMTCLIKRLLILSYLILSKQNKSKQIYLSLKLNLIVCTCGRVVL